MPPRRYRRPRRRRRARARATRPATAPAVPGPTAQAWWHPSDAGPNNGPEFQWELDHPLSTGSTLDRGDGALNAAGRLAPRVGLYDIDGILNSASVVAALHRQGSKVICYIEVGSAGNYYSAADEGNAVTYYDQLKAAGDLGRAVPGYPEKYLNINGAVHGADYRVDDPAAMRGQGIRRGRAGYRRFVHRQHRFPDHRGAERGV